LSSNSENSRLRFPGVRPFQVDEQHLFFGREEEIQTLYGLLSIEQVVVLYGISGIGKSSLIQAGLIPRLEEDYVKQGDNHFTAKYKPAVFRFFGNSSDLYKEDDQPQETNHPVQKFIARFQELIDPDAGSYFDHWLKKEDLRMWHVVKSYLMKPGVKSMPILILDQFEELFTYSDKAIDQFRVELNELLHTQVPQDLRDQLDRDANGDSHLKALLNTPKQFKILIGIRSDKYSLLNRLNINYLTKKGFEIQPLSRSQASRAMTLPAKFPLQTPPYSRTFEFNEVSKQFILDYLTNDNNKNVEAFQLQVLCSYFEGRIIEDQQYEINVSSKDSLDDVYANFYRLQLELYFEEEYIRMIIQELIEEGLIFEEGRRRIRAFGSQLKKQFGVSQSLLDILVNKTRLIREIDTGEHTMYELSHDSLVEPVLRSKTLRELKTAQLLEEEAAARARAKEERSRNLRATQSLILEEIAAIDDVDVRANVRQVLLYSFIDDEKKISHTIEKRTLIEQYGWTEAVINQLNKNTILSQYGSPEFPLYKLDDKQILEALLAIRDEQNTQQADDKSVEEAPVRIEVDGYPPRGVRYVDSKQSLDALEDIAEDIIDDRCIVFLGGDTPVFKNNETFLEALLKNIEEEYGLSRDSSDFRPVNPLVNIKSGRSRRRVMRQMRELNRFPIQVEEYELLAQIPFSLYFSFNYHNFLSQIFEQYNFVHSFQFVQPGYPPKPLKIIDKNRPLIYNLYGYTGEDESLVLSFEDLMRLIEEIAMGGRNIPVELKEKLSAANSFLFFDVNFSPYTILLIRLLLPRLLDRQQIYIINRFPVKDQLLEDYLPRCVFIQDREAFIYELHQMLEREGVLRNKKLSSVDDFSRLKELLTLGEIKSAFRAFGELLSLHSGTNAMEEELNVLSYRFSRLERKKSMELLSHEDFRIEEAQIVTSLIRLINRFEENH
jgi:hypothetical protein